MTPCLPIIASCTSRILAENYTSTGVPLTVSDMWPLRFQKRKLKYFKRRHKTLKINQKQAHNPENLGRWYSLFFRLCKRYGILDWDIWNMNKTRFMIGRRQDQCVLTRNKKRLSFTGCSTNRKLVTVLIVVNGGGTVILPMARLPGKVYEEHWYLTTSSKDDCLIAVSESSFSNDH